jgi:hypothetical protein
MKPVRRLPRLGPHPELVTYRCEHCGQVATLPAADD